MKLSQGINVERLQQRIMALGEIGKTQSGGVTRRALSSEDKQGHQLVIGWMQELGMNVRYDHFGNLIGRLEGNLPDMTPVIIGSHIDSVKNGGKFDGVIGVLGGIEVAQTLCEEGFSHTRPLEIIAFCEEEGSRFNDGLFGSRGVAGKLNEADLLKKDEQGITRLEALQNFSNQIQPKNMEQSVLKKGDVHAYLEMHIEQGPYLEAEELPIAVVTDIAGPHWMTITLDGEAGHAGTVPMHLRKDPVPAASEIILFIERLCNMPDAKETVGTVGILEAVPGGSNIIPAKVRFTLDLRDIDLNRREDLFKRIVNKIQEVCKKRGVDWNIEEGMRIPPVSCSHRITSLLLKAMEDIGLPSKKMVSGAGHDAMLMTEVTDVGMIFVRCKKGISHQPEEWADAGDIAKGTETLLAAAKVLLNE
ncbi:M20 family metallo-hydrolase [Bhargavaea ginsengi]|uniref:M20 family metallo-hydrolase n=1 Tax=Bhargavaea ginsengi TaxID=426757 RepID=UPI00203C8350|nr:M20 family metallo-hydrolase [Bhargavaea ginsengi]MCM3087519.1 M20 family metallo-hydrolase [Bhargavaea ginsengi]